MADWQPFALGVLGGFIADFLSLYAYRRRGHARIGQSPGFSADGPRHVAHRWRVGLGYHQQLPATNIILALHVGLSLRSFSANSLLKICRGLTKRAVDAP